MENKKIGWIVISVLLVGIFVYSLFFAEIKYTVVFYDGDKVVNSYEAKKNSKITLPEDPSKEGYTFEGWLYETELIDKDYVVTSDMKVEANYKEKTTTTTTTKASKKKTTKKTVKKTTKKTTKKKSS